MAVVKIFRPKMETKFKKNDVYQRTNLFSKIVVKFFNNGLNYRHFQERVKTFVRITPTRLEGQTKFLS